MTEADTAIAPTEARLTPWALRSPASGPWSLSATAWFQDRLWLASGDRVYCAGPEDVEWSIAYRKAQKVLEPHLAETAQKLGIVKDGPAAALMGEKVPGSFGIGPLSVVHAPGGAAPHLFAVLRSLWGAEILVSDGAVGFRRIPVPRGLTGTERTALAGVVTAGPWLVTAAAPVEARAKGKLTRLPMGPLTVYAAEAATGHWHPASEPGLGDGVSGGVTAFATAHGRLYVAVEDVYRGFEVWAAEPGPTLPWRWTRVLSRGAFRFSLAPKVTAMAAFGDALYLATGISESGFGQDRTGPAAAEVLRVAADGTWDIVVGAPRFTPDGLKVPLSGLPPGFGDPFASLVTSFVAANGVLYAGTRNTRAEYIWNAKPEDKPEPAPFGARIWATSDGFDWHALETAGHDTPGASAVRGLWSGPRGLGAAIGVNHAVAVTADSPADPPAPDALRMEDIQIWM